MIRQLGYSSLADVIDKYPGFFWNGVSKYLGEAINLNLTGTGWQ